MKKVSAQVIGVNTVIDFIYNANAFSSYELVY